MSNLIEFELEDGTTVYVETAVNDPAPQRGLQRAGRGSTFGLEERASVTLEAALSIVRPTAERIVAVLQDVSGPEEVSLEFGVGFTAKAGVFFASVDSNVAFKISLKWKAKNDAGEQSDNKADG